MSLFARAHLNLNLTPAERAILRFIEGTLIGAIVAGLQAGLPLLNDAAIANPASVDWGSVLHTFAAAFIAAIVLAVRKYFAAKADPALSTPVISAPAPTASTSEAVASSTSADPAFPPGVPLATLQSQLAPAE